MDTSIGPGVTVDSINQPVSMLQPAPSDIHTNTLTYSNILTPSWLQFLYFTETKAISSPPAVITLQYFHCQGKNWRMNGSHLNLPVYTLQLTWLVWSCQEL